MWLNRVLFKVQRECKGYEIVNKGEGVETVTRLQWWPTLQFGRQCLVVLARGRFEENKNTSFCCHVSNCRRVRNPSGPFSAEHSAVPSSRASRSNQD